MTGKIAMNQKNMMVFNGRSHPDLGEAVTKELDTHITPMRAEDFANGEIFVRFEESVRGADCFVMQSHATVEGGDLNKWLMEQLIMIDALKRGSAKRITAILPFYPYARQDKKHRGREPISARLISDMLQTAGADRLVSVDLHTDQIQGFFDGPVDHMHAMPVLTDYIKEHYPTENMCIVSPDAGRVKVAEKWANVLGGAPMAFVHKTRSVDVANEVVANRVVGDVKGKDCILVDDMIDTGGTIAGAAKILKDEGAKSVVVACTHGVFSGQAREKLSNCGAEEVITTDTIPQSTEGWDNLTVLSIAPLLARTINEIFENGSVTTLFEGSA